MIGQVCAGCGRPISEPSMVLADDAIVHFTDYSCLIRYEQVRKARAVPQKETGPKIRRPGIELTEEQRVAVAAIKEAIKRRETFALHGLAGTGKTTVAAHIARSRPGVHLCAPTAKAASVLSEKTGIKASTVHSAFYHFVKRDDDSEKLVFRPKHKPGSLKDAVLLLDECSMIPKDIADDILKTGVTVIAFGDPGQLKPVTGDQFFTKASFTLTEIHRQALESPIIRQAHAVRADGCYVADGEGVQVVNRLTGADVRAADIVLTGKRKTRMRMNAEVRRVRGLRSPLPQKGEPLVCLRTARKYGLCNGAIYYASRDWEEGESTVGITTEDGDIEVYAVFLSPGHEYDELDLPPGGWMTAFAFGYALTVHMAQGSEFDAVLLVDEWFREDRISWLYTGLTRTSQRLVIARRAP